MFWNDLATFHVKWALKKNKSKWANVLFKLDLSSTLESLAETEMTQQKHSNVVLMKDANKLQRIPS